MTATGAGIDSALWLIVAPRVAPREGELIGVVRLELPEAALPWREAMDEHVLRRRGQYIAGVEYVARSFGALEPFVWEGDALTLVFRGLSIDDLPTHTYKAAKELWNRIRTELDLSVKIGAHVGRGSAGAEPGSWTGADVDDCKRLAAESPPGYLTLSEDIALPSTCSRGRS